MKYETPTVAWFHKVDGTLGLVVHRHKLVPEDPSLVDDLREIISEARAFAQSATGLTIEALGKSYDLARGTVVWNCDQNMMWDDDEPMPRDCTPEKPHPDVGSGDCGWALVLPEVRAFDKVDK